MSKQFLKKQRLKKNNDYQAVFRTTDFRFRENSILLLAKRTSLSHSRLGVVVGKKSIKSAVKRNRFKRKVRESYRCFHSPLGNWDVIVLIVKSKTRFDFNDLDTALSRCWEALFAYNTQNT